MKTFSRAPTITRPSLFLIEIVLWNSILICNEARVKKNGATKDAARNEASKDVTKIFVTQHL